jgi:hypothetical protein
VAAVGLRGSLNVLESPYCSLVRPILGYVDDLDEQYKDDVLSVIVPELYPRNGGNICCITRQRLQLRGTLLFRKGVVVISVPYHLER